MLLSYENDAIAAKKDDPKGIDYVTPDDTILIQTPLAATKDARAGDGFRQVGVQP